MAIYAAYMDIKTDSSTGLSATYRRTPVSVLLEHVRQRFPCLSGQAAKRSLRLQCLYPDIWRIVHASLLLALLQYLDEGCSTGVGADRCWDRAECWVDLRAWKNTDEAGQGGLHFVSSCRCYAEDGEVSAARGRHRRLGHAVTVLVTWRETRRVGASSPWTRPHRATLAYTAGDHQSCIFLTRYFALMSTTARKRRTSFDDTGGPSIKKSRAIKQSKSKKTVVQGGPVWPEYYNSVCSA